MKLCIEQEKDFDMRDFKFLIAQIRVIEEDFCELQLWLKIATLMTSSIKRAIHGSALLLEGRARDTVTRQRMGQQL